MMEGETGKEIGGVEQNRLQSPLANRIAAIEEAHTTFASISRLLRSIFLHIRRLTGIFIMLTSRAW